MCPQKFKRRGELPTLATPPRVGPKTLANPKSTRVGKRGVHGAQAPWRGVWGVSPHKTKKGANSYPLKPRHEWDLKRRQTLSQRGWAKRGSRGRSPLAGGMGDVPPQIQMANPKPTRVDKQSSKEIHTRPILKIFPKPRSQTGVFWGFVVK